MIVLAHFLLRKILSQRISVSQAFDDEIFLYSQLHMQVIIESPVNAMLPFVRIELAPWEIMNTYLLPPFVDYFSDRNSKPPGTPGRMNSEATFDSHQDIVVGFGDGAHHIIVGGIR